MSTGCSARSSGSGGASSTTARISSGCPRGSSTSQEQERRTLARELHDEVGQALTAVKMDIGIALRADVDPRVRTALEEARDISETTLRSVRDMSQLLHPSVLDDFGLPATLTDLPAQLLSAHRHPRAARRDDG